MNLFLCISSFLLIRWAQHQSLCRMTEYATATKALEFFWSERQLIQKTQSIAN